MVHTGCVHGPFGAGTMPLDSGEMMVVQPPMNGDERREGDPDMFNEPTWWASWREYDERLAAAVEAAEAADAERERHARLAAAEAAPLIPLHEIDEEWKRRMMFVMARRPDAVATR